MPSTSDSFNRANNALTLGSTDGGSILAWSPQNSSVWGISSNQAYCVTDGTGGESFAVLNLVGSWGITITIATLPGGAGSIGIVFRYSDPDNFFALFVDGANSNTVTLIKVEASAHTGIATYGTLSAGGTIGVAGGYFGDFYTVYKNASPVDEIEDAFNSSQYHAGLFAIGNVGRIDGFLSDFDGVIPSDPPPPAAGLLVRTVQMDGTEIDQIPLAIVGDLERTLNQPDAASWSFPKGAYTPAQIPVLGTDAQPVEVQIWTTVEGEPDVLLFWGPTIDLQGSGVDGALHATGAGVDWYLIRRYLDGQRPNLLDNPSFEADLDDWFEGGSFTSTSTTDGKVLGTKAARLVSSGGDTHLHQPQTVTATGVGTLLTVAAWFQIESFTAPAYAKRGLYVEGIQASVVRATSTVQIDENTPTDLWIRAETTIWIPPDQTWTIDVRCYAIDGMILWDAVELVEMKAVSTAGLVGTVTGEADLTRIVRQHVLHLQDAAVGKSDVNIVTDPDRALIGVTMAKHIQWADHIAWDSQLREFVERGDGIDYAILYDPDAGTREFYVFYPRRGVDRSGNTDLVFPGNIADYRWHRDGSATVTTATWLGDGDGPDREEGFFSDASFIGGVTLEDVKQAPTGSAISSLEPLAQGEVVLLNNPPRIIEVDIRPDATFVGGDFDGVPLLNALSPGDWVPLTIDDGYVQESGSSWRIVKLVFHGTNRVLTATLNEDLG